MMLKDDLFSRLKGSSSRRTASLKKNNHPVSRPRFPTSFSIPSQISENQNWSRNVGPCTPAPDYRKIDTEVLQSTVMSLFRRKLALAIGSDVEAQGYDGIIQLTQLLNSKSYNPRETQIKTVEILLSLFPSWIPIVFKTFFAKPFPEFSARMNALATAFTCRWLMGKVTINDVETDQGKMGKGNGVLVERCRYLEQSGCASVCINSCKIPTQEFFSEHMGLQLTMTPCYEDFSCQFAFGKTPLKQQDDPTLQTPCFSQCPTKRRSANCPGIKPTECV